MKVAGYCPMGCGQTLFLGEGNRGEGGYVTCSLVDCPRPDAVSTLLEDHERHHIASLNEDGFSLKHPLCERLDDDLFDCDMHARLRALDEMPIEEPGIYRVLDLGDGLAFERLES